VRFRSTRSNKVERTARTRAGGRGLANAAT
jgi:hypothetical protein